MKRLLFIFNPWSGKAHVKDHLFEITDEFAKAGYLVTVYPTQRSRDCYEYLLKCAGEYDVIVCSGGDGTLNEAVAGMIDSGCDRPMGYIPSGSTNDFASSLLIPKTVSHAVKNIIEGTPYLCDVGSFNGRWFNYVAAFGIFTEVSNATPQQLKNTFGHPAYIIESVKSFASLKSYQLKMQMGDMVIEDKFIYGMVANSKSVGGMKGLTGKEIKLDDGLFEVILIKGPKNPVEFQTMFNGFIFQNDNSMVMHFKCSDISFTSEEQIPWVLDGEFGGNQTDVNIRVENKKVRYLLAKHP